MHGLIFAELKKYVDAKLGAHAWTNVLKQAGFDRRIFVSAQHYSDGEAVALMTAASSIAGRPLGELLEDFGAFMVPDLVGLYGSLLDPSWKTLDVIEHTEHTIHRVVRLRNPGAAPPELQCTRVSTNEVEIEYASARKMCTIARGIVRGLAQHFGEHVTIDERACMNHGAPACLLSVRV